MKFKALITVLTLLTALLTVSSSYLLFTPTRAQEAEYFQVLQVNWGTAQSPLEVAPGDINSLLTVTMQYFGPNPIYGVQAYLELPKGFTDAQGGDRCWGIIPSELRGLIQPYAPFTLQFYINVPSNATIATYSIPLTLKYRDYYTKNEVEKKLYLNVPLKGRVELEAQPLQQALSPGLLNTLKVRLKNSGSSIASELKILLVAPPQVSIVSSSKFTLDKLPPSSSFDVAVDVYVPLTLASAALTFTLQASYKNAYGYTSTATYNLGVYVLQPVAPVLTVTPSKQELASGLINPISLTLTNRGPGSLHNLTLSVTLQPPLALQGSDGTWYLNTLNEGGSETVTLNIYIPPTQAVYTAASSLTLKFIDQTNTQRVEVRSLSFTVLPQELIPDVGIEVSPETFTAGTSATLTVTIRNRSHLALNQLLVTLTPPQMGVQGNPLTLKGSEGKWLVGSLKPGEQYVVKVPVEVGLTSGLYNLGFTLSYRDEYGASFQENRQVGIRINPLTEQSIISLGIEPDELASGGINRATLTVKNEGSDPVNSFTLLLTLPTQLALIGSDGKWSIGSLPPKTSISIPIEVYVPPLDLTTAQATATITYIDPYGATKTELRTLGLLVRGIVDIKLVGYTVVPEKPVIGQPFSITLTITNTGTTTARAVSAQPLIGEGITTLGSQTVFVGDLGVNTPTSFTLTFMALNNTKPGLHLLNVNVNYTDNLRVVHTNTFTLSFDVERIAPTRAPRTEGLQVYAWIQPLIIYAALILIGFTAGYLVKRRRTA